LTSARIANAKGAPRLRFARAVFAIDAGARSPGARATAHRVPAAVGLSLAGRRAGAHVLTVRIAYRETRRRGVTVTVVRTLRTKFNVC
jgi:hypothetical protein